MKKLIFALTALTLVAPALAQERPAQADQAACSPMSQETTETDACLERSALPSYDETRGNFGDSDRPLSLTEDDWDD